jgi:hypothetical protein
MALIMTFVIERAERIVLRWRGEAHGRA